MPAAPALRLLTEPAGQLLGRRRECQALERLLDSLAEGRSDTLVVRGRGGVGKTALLEYARDHASGCRVLSTSAVRSESELAFAGLHQLCASVLDGVQQLPAPQRDALGRAFGMSDGAPSDRFFIGLAVLNLLTDVAEEQPVLCLVDDAQWLDEASAHVLAFVARRVARGPIGFVLAADNPGPALADLPDLHLRDLSYRDARVLLRSALRGPLDDRLGERIIAETNGNPRALLELAAELAPARVGGGFGPPAAAIIGRTVDSRIEQLLAALPDAAREFLLVAAAEPLGEPLLLWRAAEALGLPLDAANTAQSSGLLEVGSRVRFRRPVVRSSVYGSASLEARRAAHRALADSTNPRSDPARRAWHLAHAAASPDEEVAAELERCAARAAVRGGPAATAAMLSTAAGLTPDPAARARRALSAAEAEHRAGSPDGALHALVTAERGPLDSRDRARADLLRAQVACYSDSAGAGAQLFAVARRLEELDPELARDAYLDAFAMAARSNPADGPSAAAIAQAALALDPPRTTRTKDVLLEGLALQLTAGDAAARTPLAQAVGAYAGASEIADLGPVSGWLAPHAASVLWELHAERTIAERQVVAARESGVPAALTDALAQLIVVHLRDGDLAEATELTRELDAAIDAADRQPVIDVGVLTAAYRGREDEARELIDAARSRVGSESCSVGALVVELSHLILSNGLGLYDDAARSAQRVLALEPASRPPWALPELIEAAVRAGVPDAAAAVMDELAERVGTSGTRWGLGIEARSRALLCDGEEAEPLYLDAIARLAGPGTRVDLARARLLYGEWLRREGRRVDARKELRAAFDVLSDMGIEAFAERARRELRATGETARKRTLETRDDLTPQEEQIARLAREGLSNPAIGARLYISPRTVEWHMRKIFLKLGISSRVSLRDALPEQTAVSA